MAKGKKSVFFCQNCGHEEAKWLGQCPGCGEWNTFVEEKIGSGVTKGSTQGAKAVRELVREAKVIPNFRGSTTILLKRTGHFRFCSSPHRLLYPNKI